MRYLAFSGHRKGHGVHSPFAFDVVSGFFRNKIDDEVVKSIRRLRREMKNDKRVINVHDLGAGAIKEGKNVYSRKVSDIAYSSSTPEKYGFLLAQMASKFGKPYIIELGSSVGISALYMALSSPKLEVHTIEGCPETAGIAQENFKKAGASNVKLHVGSFDEILPDIMKKNEAPGVVFIDGNHRKEPLLEYFKLVSDCANNDTAVIIDDIYLSPEMSEAWQEIKKQPEVSLTIDLYRMGMVFFRKGINNNHFVVRY